MKKMMCWRMKKLAALVLAFALALSCGAALAEASLPSVEAAVVAPAVAPDATPAPTATPVSAAPEDAEAEKEEEQMPLSVADVRVQEGLQRQISDEEQRFEGTGLSASRYVDYSFEGTQTMQGIFNTISLYARLPDYAVPTGAMLRVSYTASDMILREYSTLTFAMNSVPFFSCAVERQDDGAPTVLYIEVPIDLLQDGYNLLEISGYVRLTDDEGCTDDFNGANWLKFADTTCLRVGYEIVPDADFLCYYPYPFLSLEDATGENCAVAVSDEADNREMEAALLVMTQLGSLTTGQNDIQLTTIGVARRDCVIYFGLEENTPAEILSLLDERVPSSGALIRRVSDGGREYLLVIAREGEALMEAARLLSDSSRIEQIESRDSYVSVGESDVFISASQANALALSGQYTMKDILGHGASFSGPFRQEMTLYLPLPDDYVLSNEGRFTFHIRYSENLDFDRSLMTVYWGSNVPLYSHRLTQEGASGETVSFAVPADAVGASGAAMTVAFDLEIQDLDCTPRQMNMPWAYVAENSTFYLPWQDGALLSLSRVTAPFQKDSQLDNVLVVVPDRPTAAEMLLCGRVMSLVGSGSGPYGSLRVCRAREFSAEDADYNLVVIGTGGSNGLIEALNPSLHFQYNEAMNAILSNEKIILSEAYSKNIGVIQLILSPYAQGRAALVVTAPGDDGLAALTEQVSVSKKMWAMDKEAMILDSRGRATAYQFSGTLQTQTDERPSLAETLQRNREPMLFALIGTGCMLLALVGVILVMLRARARSKKQ